MSKHTLGPWKAESIHVYDSVGRQLFWCSRALLVPWAENLANAKLAAAAPDMLAMLREVYLSSVAFSQLSEELRDQIGALVNAMEDQAMPIDETEKELLRLDSEWDRLLAKAQEFFHQDPEPFLSLAKKQREGYYTPESNGMMALQCIETLALLLIENHKARLGDTPYIARIDPGDPYLDPKDDGKETK